ncbi:MAG TPA: hypothetical protein VLK84_28610 [Longimicrobium sp.]|nr:hypothetical protein [Longimicrobium sp.]
MKTPHRLALAALLPLAAACSDQSVTETATAPAGPSAVVGVPPTCVTFGPNPPSGTVWGVPAGNAPGTVVHVENSIDVSVDRLALPGGVFVYDLARLEDAALIGWGTLNSVHMRDISTTYHFMAAGGWVPMRVRFQYQDLGAVENLAVNGALYVGNIAAAPAALGGATVVVGPGWVDISGAPINTVRIGGQNFRVDNVCATP